MSSKFFLILFLIIVKFYRIKIDAHKNCTGDHTSSAGESSSSGVKNLMSAFNETEEELSGKDPIDDDIMNPDKQVYEAVLSGEQIYISPSYK